VFGHEEKDLAMRRWQTVREHPRRGFRDDTTITIDVDDSLLWLERPIFYRVKSRAAQTPGQSPLSLNFRMWDVHHDNLFRFRNFSV